MDPLPPDTPAFPADPAGPATFTEDPAAPVSAAAASAASSADPAATAATFAADAAATITGAATSATDPATPATFAANPTASSNEPAAPAINPAAFATNPAAFATNPAAFAADGVVCVRGALDADEVAVAAAAIEAVLASPGPLTQVASGADDPGAFPEDFRRWQDVPQIERLARHSRIPAIAAALMATPQVRFYHDHVLVKEGRTRQRTPWHQDQPYYNVDGRGVSAWIPVDPVPEAGCLELVAGSHLGPWLMPRTFLLGEARWFPEGSLAELPDIEADRDAFDIRSFDLAPGDAIFFDFLTVHGAPGFPFPGRRRVLSLRYLSAQARHAPRAWRTSPPFDGLEAELPPGAPLDHPLFPLVWPSASA